MRRDGRNPRDGNAARVRRRPAGGSMNTPENSMKCDLEQQAGDLIRRARLQAFGDAIAYIEAVSEGYKPALGQETSRRWLGLRLAARRLRRRLREASEQ